MHQPIMTAQISVLDLFTIGIGPSSSHTVGPMRAARQFLDRLTASGLDHATGRIEVHLYGSLALTGKGHGTDKAVLLGLEGETPEEVDIDSVPRRIERIRETKSLRLPAGRQIPFDESSDLLFHRRSRCRSIPMECDSSHTTPRARPYSRGPTSASAADLS